MEDRSAQSISVEFSLDRGVACRPQALNLELRTWALFGEPLPAREPFFSGLLLRVSFLVLLPGTLGLFGHPLSLRTTVPPVFPKDCPASAPRSGARPGLANQSSASLTAGIWSRMGT